MFDLQAWQSHQLPAMRQYEVSTRPTKLAQAYEGVGYFSRKVRAIEVLIDGHGIVQENAFQCFSWCKCADLVS